MGHVKTFGPPIPARFSELRSAIGELRRSEANSDSPSISAEEGPALAVILSIPLVILSAAKDQVKSLSLAELAIRLAELARRGRTAQKTPKSAFHTPRSS